MTATTVRTPADLIVIATCPTCEQVTGIRMVIGAELLVSDEGSELRLKARAKGVAHVCEQMPLDLEDLAADVRALPIEDQAVIHDAIELKRSAASRGVEITVDAASQEVFRRILGGRTVDPETGEILDPAECVRNGVNGGDCETHSATWPEVAKACWAVSPPPRKRAAS